MNRKSFNRINYGMFILSAQGETQPQGCVVNSLHQVTSSVPYKFSVTVSGRLPPIILRPCANNSSLSISKNFPN